MGNANLNPRQRQGILWMLDDIADKKCGSRCPKFAEEHGYCRHDLAALARFEITSEGRVPTYLPTLSRLESLGVLRGERIAGGAKYRGY